MSNEFKRVTKRILITLTKQKLWYNFLKIERKLTKYALADSENVV